MSTDGIDNLKPTQAASWMALFFSSGTLICCALPALLVVLGAGAALSTLIAWIPQLVWFSEHKTTVFAAAVVMVIASGLLQWRSRNLPCPADPALADACHAMRRRSLWVNLLSVLLLATGGGFAFVAPYIPG